MKKVDNKLLNVLLNYFKQSKKSLFYHFTLQENLEINIFQMFSLHISFPERTMLSYCTLDALL